MRGRTRLLFLGNRMQSGSRVSRLLRIETGRWPITDEIEIGWRLAHDAWGQGYAREAAEASLAWGWANLPVPTIAAITVPANTRSRGLMERLGMVRVADGDFDHPDVPDGSPLQRHILYRIARSR